MSQPAKAPAATVSTHVLDTAAGRPAQDVVVALWVPDGAWAAASAQHGAPPDDRSWLRHAVARTDADGRCGALPPLPTGAAYAQLRFETGPYLRRRPGGGFFPEVTVAFAVAAGEHYHVPLLLSPFGYSVYRGS